MALTKAQVSLVTVATLGAAPGGYESQLKAFNTQDEVAAFIQAEGLLSAGTNAEYALQVAENLGAASASDLFSALESGVSRAEATVDFANAQLVAQGGSIAKVDAAVASTTTSLDLTALKGALAEATTDSLTVTFEDTDTNQQNGSSTDAVSIYNVGKAELDAGAGKISADYTFELKNQIDENDTFNGLFLSPVIERQGAETSGSQIVLELRNLREAADSTTPLKDLPTNGFGFNIDGELVMVQSNSIDDAETYAELLAAIEARVDELANGVNLPDGADAALYAKLASFEVSLGDVTQAQERDANGDVTETYDVNVTQVILKDNAGATLDPVGYSNRDGIIDGSGFTLFAQMSDEAGTTITKLITTNLVADNVGYGSQGATVNLAGQSASDKGVEEIKVTANNGVWFTALKSEATTNHLERVELQTGSDSYFRVGTQKNDVNHLVALVDEDFDNAGLVDVQQLAASAAGSVAVNSYITDAVINRFDLKDTGLYTTDDTDALIDYDLTSGSDVLQLKIDSEVVAYADTVVDIDTGAGNDFVHLQLDNGNSYGATWLTNQQENDNISIDATGGNNTIWTEGAGNVSITTGTGSDTIYADNSGRVDLAANIASLELDVADAQVELDAATTAADIATARTALNTAQTALDTALAPIEKLTDLGYGTDVNGMFIMNAGSTDLEDILTLTDYGTGAAAASAPQVFNTYKETVQISFLGFESKFVEIAYDKNNLTTNTQQVNQAIKDAINNDATLSKLLVATEFPGNVLVVESLIDGVRAETDLTVTFTAPANAAGTPTAGQLQTTAAEETKVAELAADTAKPYTATDLATEIGDGGTNEYFDNTAAADAFVTDGTAEIVGSDSTAESDNVINAGAGTDVIVLGTGANSNDTVVLSGNFGKTTIVNFTDAGAPGVADGNDLLDFSSYFTDTTTAGVSENITIADARGTAAAAADDEVTILNFSDLELGTASGIDTTTTGFSNVTTAQLKVELAAAGVTGDATAVSEHVFLIENDTTFGTANAGEYMVVTASTTATDGALTNVAIVGTLDFGATLAGTVAVADFA